MQHTIAMVSLLSKNIRSWLHGIGHDISGIVVFILSPRLLSPELAK
jgi:hypothetical protein